MIIFNTTINVENSIADEWLAWIKEVYIPEVMSTGCFVAHQLLKVLVKEEDGETYSMQYMCETMKHLHKYEIEHGQRLKQLTMDKFGSKIVSFSTLLETV